MVKPALLELLLFFLSRLPALHNIDSSADIAAVFIKSFGFIIFFKQWRNINLLHHILVLEV